MSKERDPVDMVCPLYKMAAIISHQQDLTSWEAEPPEGVRCDGEECALWSKGSGLKRCGLRKV